MHLYFEQNSSAKCDCSVLSLSWMGKVPDELPEDEGWKLNRTNYYQEGWLATGNVRGIVGVTFTSSHCKKNAELPLRTNYNLRGHRSDVILVKWNEPYQKLASCDSSGVIFVWIKYEGRWSIELINDRNTPVTYFSWSHDGRMALICYQDGFVLVGSVAGQRYWSSMLNIEATITCGIWTPDDQQVYFGTTAGQIIIMDVHGAMVSQVQLSSEVGITNMAWSCEKFKMEEGEDTEPGVTNASERSFVLAVSFQNGYIYLLKNYDDVSPIHIHTEFDGRYMAMEWSNSRELLAVAGALFEPENKIVDVPTYKNMVKFYSDFGVLLYCTPVPGTQMPVSAMTWGHNDRRLFVATGQSVQVARTWRKLGSLQLLARLRVRTALRRQPHLAKLPLPPRLTSQVATLFTHTISCCVPEASAVRDFVSRAAHTGRLHCTMLRRSAETGASATGAGAAGVSYTLYLEHLGGLVPLLKGRRISKIRPEFVIYDPQYEGVDSDDIHWFRVRSSGEVISTSSSSGNSAHSNCGSSPHTVQHYPVSDSSDSDKDEGCSGSPRLQRRKKGRHRSTKSQIQIEKEFLDNVDELAYIDSLPEDVPLVEVTSNIWGTKFKIHGLAKNIPANLGQVTYKTSLLHLQPRQMTLVMTELQDDLPIGPDPNFNPNIFSEDEEDTVQSLSEWVRPANGDVPSVVAPVSPRGSALARARSSLFQHIVQTDANANGGAPPALARPESYEDEFPYIDLADVVNYSESVRFNAPSKGAKGHARESGHAGNGNYGPLRNVPSSSSQRSGSSHCPGRHAISPLCCEGSVPTLQSPKNAVAPSDIIFDRPPAQTIVSYHSCNADYAQNVQQIKSTLSGSECHSHRPSLDLNLSLNHNRQTVRTVKHEQQVAQKNSVPLFENCSTRFKHCSKKEKSPSPFYDLKYIDEESAGLFASAASLESPCSKKLISVLPVSPAGVLGVSAPIVDNMIRSCSVGYLDVVQAQLVPSEAAINGFEAPKRLVLVNKRQRGQHKHRPKRQGVQAASPSLNTGLGVDDSERTKTPHLKGCGKSRSLDSSDMLSITRTLNVSPLPTSVEESSKPMTEVDREESVKLEDSINNNKIGGSCIDTVIESTANKSVKGIKDCSKLSFFVGSMSPLLGRTRKRDLPICEVCKCVTSAETHICNTCAVANANGTPTKKSRGLFRDSKHSSAADRSRSSNSRLGSDRASEVEIERATTPSPVEHKNGNSLSGAALATLEQLLYLVRDRGSNSGGENTPPSSPAPRIRLPRSSPASPAPSKKNKRTSSASPIRKHLLNSPLLNIRRNKNKNHESSDDEVGTSCDDVVNGKNYTDLETFQKAQLRQKLKRGKVEPVGSNGGWNSQPSAVRREFVMHNKAPMWNESSQVYQLDFGGRVTQESAKNFQIEFRGKQVMQFGRIDGNAYTLDFQYPFSALQAFAVALANVTQRLK